jgi:mannose-6-phosphate isomerase-like protein (cupin superfamily)
VLTKNVFEELKKAQVDPKVGIKVLKITGDEQISLFAAEIAPGKAVRPHYHEKGVELYHLLQGEGEMKTGRPADGAPVWEETFRMKKGDAVTILPGKTHTLKNDGKENVYVLFICMPEHLRNDRFFVG